MHVEEKLREELTQRFTQMFLRLAASTATGNVSVAIIRVKNVNVVFERKTFFKAQAKLHEWQGKHNAVVSLKYIKTYLGLNTVQQNKHSISVFFACCSPGWSLKPAHFKKGKINYSATWIWVVKLITAQQQAVLTLTCHQTEEWSGKTGSYHSNANTGVTAGVMGFSSP